MYWCGLQGLEAGALPAGLTSIGTWLELLQAGDSLYQQSAADPPQGTAEFISHIWGISGKVHARKGRKYHTGGGEAISVIIVTVRFLFWNDTHPFIVNIEYIISRIAILKHKGLSNVTVVLFPWS